MKRWLAALLSALTLLAPLPGMFAVLAETPVTQESVVETPRPEPPAQVKTEAPAETAAPVTAAPVTASPATPEPAAPVVTPEPTSAQPEETTAPEETAAPQPAESSGPEATPTPELTPEPGVTAEPTVEATATAEAKLTPAPDASPTPLPDDEEEDQADSDRKLEDGALQIVSTKPYAGWHGVTPSGEQGMAIPMLFQTDYPDTVCTIRGIERSVATSGCAATSLSMVIAYLTGNTEQNPSVLFCDSVERGLYQGAGWSHNTLSYYASQYGVKNRWIRNSGKAIVEALSAGKPVIAHMGPGIFTRRGHYVVLRGLTADGKVLINDPVSPSKCGQAFPIKTLLTQAKNGQAFMVCWADDMPEYSAEQIAQRAATDETEGELAPMFEIEAVPASGSGTVRQNSARLRSAPDKAAEVVGLLSRGDEVEIMGMVAPARDGCVWWQISCGGQTGFIHGDMLSAQANTPEPTVEPTPAALGDAAEAEFETAIESTAAPTPEPTPEPTATPEPVRSCVPRENAVRLHAEANLESPVVCLVHMTDTLEIVEEIAAADGTIWFAVKDAHMIAPRYVRSDMVVEN